MRCAKTCKPIWRDACSHAPKWQATRPARASARWGTILLFPILCPCAEAICACMHLHSCLPCGVGDACCMHLACMHLRRPASMPCCNPVLAPRTAKRIAKWQRTVPPWLRYRAEGATPWQHEAIRLGCMCAQQPSPLSLCYRAVAAICGACMTHASAPRSQATVHAWMHGWYVVTAWQAACAGA